MLRSSDEWSESPLGRYDAFDTSDNIVGLAKARSIREEVLYVAEKQE